MTIFGAPKIDTERSLSCEPTIWAVSLSEILGGDNMHDSPHALSMSKLDVPYDVRNSARVALSYTHGRPVF